MTFIHGYLLAGLVLLGVPVIIHLLNRQKPQPLPFPAFRFLKLKRTTNRRKMQLQNLLLLLARLLVLALVILALARPQITGARTPLSGTQPVHAVLIFDTSLSMDYTSGGESRLDAARARAREVLALIAPDSKIRLLETGEPLPPLNTTDGWLQGRGLVEGRLGSLRTRPVVETLPRLVEGGIAHLNRLAVEEVRPQLLVVFSDRTVPSWPVPTTGAKLAIPPEVQSLYVDVGIDRPRDLAIDSIETRPSLVVPGAKLEIRVGVRALGADFNTTLNCLFENDASTDLAQTRQPIRLSDGQRQVFTFQRVIPPRPAGAPEAPVQIFARFDGSDPLTFNNTAYATVAARNQRKLLLIADNTLAARPTRVALEVIAKDRPADAFAVTPVTSARAAELEPATLQENAVIILHQVVQPTPALWDKLSAYVEAGGGLIVIPPGDELGDRREVFNSEGRRVQLLPGTLQRLQLVPLGQPAVPWKDFRIGHPLTDPFRSWLKTGDALVVSYWEVDATGNEAGVIATYAGGKEHPALLERRRGRGRVLLFTVPLDGRTLPAPDGRSLHNYWKDSAFGLVLLDLACQDLAGRTALPALRFPRGQEVRLPLPMPAPTPPFKLTGPGLSESETRVAWNPAVNPGAAPPDLVLPQVTTAGNFQLRDPRDRVFAAFSMVEPLDENNLARLPVETIETVLGEKTLLPLGHGVELKERITESITPPTELLPLVLLALLFLLVAESWLANRYYKGDPAREEQAANLRPTGELTRTRGQG